MYRDGTCANHILLVTSRAILQYGEKVLLYAKLKFWNFTVMFLFHYPTFS